MQCLPGRIPGFDLWMEMKGRNDQVDLIHGYHPHWDKAQCLRRGMKGLFGRDTPSWPRVARKTPVGSKAAEEQR